MTILCLVFVGPVLAAASLIARLRQQTVPELCVMRALGFRSLRVALLVLFEVEVLTSAGGALGLVGTAYALRACVVYTLRMDLAPLVFRAPLTTRIACGAWT